MNNNMQTYNWKDAHNAAMRAPCGQEKIIVNTLVALRQLADSRMCRDCLFRDHFIDMIKAARQMLEYGTGRIDEALVECELQDMAKKVGYDLDRDLWTK